MRKLLVNSILWGLGQGDRIPAAGARVEFTGEYAPSDAAFGGYRRGQEPQQVQQS